MNNSDEMMKEVIQRLKEVIEEVREKLKSNRSLYERIEQAVRDQLVAPVLGSLGWNTADPKAVLPNERTEEGVPDYALIKDGNTVLFLEAKKLSVNIEQEAVLRQLAKYCFNEGTSYGIASNGRWWVLIRSFQQGTSVADRVLWRADLESDDLPSVYRKLASIHRDSLGRIEDWIRKTEAFDEAWNSLVNDPDAIASSLCSPFRSLISGVYPEYQIEDQEVQDFLGERVRELLSRRSVEPEGNREEEGAVEGGGVVPPGGKPQRMRLNGEWYPLEYGYQILVKTANWLIKKGRLKPSDCPVQVGGGKPLITRDGSGFRTGRQLSNGCWIETSFGNAYAIQRACQLLEKFGVRADQLSIE